MPSTMHFLDQPTWYIPPTDLTTLNKAQKQVSVKEIKTEFRAGASLTPAEANCACKDIGELGLFHMLTRLCDVKPDTQKQLGEWLRADIRTFITLDLDLGVAYATCNSAWKCFNVPHFDVASWRKQILRLIHEMTDRRRRAVALDQEGQQVITNPYLVMPRRIWDLRSNRVVDFNLRMAEFRMVKNTLPNFIPQNQKFPHFWAISHSWTADMKPVRTMVNGDQWPVPMPSGVTLEKVRREIIQLGGDYVWLDVLCLRQEAGIFSAKLKAEEWKIDVPTIGNIFVAAAVLVRYFNGLGRPFSPSDWDNPRHWLKRAWTLQEIKPEQVTLTGGLSGPTAFFLETTGWLGGRMVSLRSALSRIWKLAEDAADPSGFGCTLFDVMTEMRYRHSSNPVDKVSGVLYLLRTPRLPAYQADITPEEAWFRCCPILNYHRRLELLFDFPYRGSNTHWFPTWEQVTHWPPLRIPGYPHKPPRWERPGIPIFTPYRKLGVQGLFVVGVHLVLDVNLINCSEGRPGEYTIKCESQEVPFSASYENQLLIPDGRYTIGVLNIDGCSNFVVCRMQGTISGRMSILPQTLELTIEAIILNKVGVLRCQNANTVFHGDPRIAQRFCLFI